MNICLLLLVAANLKSCLDVLSPSIAWQTNKNALSRLVHPVWLIIFMGFKIFADLWVFISRKITEFQLYIYIYNLVTRVVCHENINPLNSLNFSNHENLNLQKQPTIWYVCTIYHNYILLQFLCHGKVAQMDEVLLNFHYSLTSVEILLRYVHMSLQQQQY